MNQTRLPHASLDLISRQLKAKKIERLLDLESGTKPLRLLEVGTGSGGISHYFATHNSNRYEVDAVDVQDGRVVSDGYRFTMVPGTKLPFKDESFDIVISNQVIEHVGNEIAQAEHLCELHRVLRLDGVGYLAMPNRWMLIEPHYHLMFLSWWPEQWRTSWLRLWRRGEHYDCRPLAPRDAQRLLKAAGFRYTQFHGEALRATFEIERPDSPLWKFFLQYVPSPAYVAVGAIFPTLLYKLIRR